MQNVFSQLRQPLCLGYLSAEKLNFYLCRLPRRPPSSTCNWGTIMSDTLGSQVVQSRDGTVATTRYKDHLAACRHPSSTAGGQWRKRLDQTMKARHEEAGCDVSVFTILRVLGVEPAADCLYVRTRPMDEFNLVNIESVCTPPAGPACRLSYTLT